MHFKMSSGIRCNLDGSKILSSGNGLTTEVLLLTILMKKALINIVRKGEMLVTHIFFFLMFSTILMEGVIFSNN